MNENRRAVISIVQTAVDIRNGDKLANVEDTNEKIMYVLGYIEAWGDALNVKVSEKILEA